MTVIKQIDSVIQSTVDAVAFAIMRHLGCGKGPIRLSLNVVLVAETLVEAALYHEPWQVILGFVLLLFAELERRQDAVAEARGLASQADAAPTTVSKLIGLGVGVYFVSIRGRAIMAVYSAALVLLAYLRRTPGTPPPSRETSHQLAEAS